MNTLACGIPDSFIYLLFGGAGVCVGLFVFGVVCLFTRMRALGLCLVCFSLLVTTGMLAWLGILP